MIHQTLPSNASMDKFPENTVTEYTTVLAEPIRFHTEWEVGLSEINFPHSFYGDSIEDSNVLMRYNKMDGEQVSLSIPPNVYKEGTRVMRALESANPDRIKLYDIGTGSYVLQLIGFKVPEIVGTYHTLLPNPDEPHNPFQNIQLTDTGIARLHLSQLIVVGTSKAFLALSVKETVRYDYIDVHCDIIRPAIQGGSLKQILRRVPVRGILEDSVYQTEVFPRVFYFPLNRNTISSIRIVLKDSTGSPIPFRSGPSSVTLSFRKKVDML